MIEKEVMIFGKKVKVKMIKISNESITRCNKNIEKNIKENKRILQLSLQDSDKPLHWV